MLPTLNSSKQAVEGKSVVYQASHVVNRPMSFWQTPLTCPVGNSVEGDNARPRWASFTGKHCRTSLHSCISWRSRAAKPCLSIIAFSYPVNTVLYLFQLIGNVGSSVFCSLHVLSHCIQTFETPSQSQGTEVGRAGRVKKNATCT